MIVGDFNIDLLKVEHKPKTKDYLDSIMTQGFPPKITLPTRFSEMNGTLIDNVLCRLSNTSINNDAGIIVTQLSDHLPYFICLRTMKVDKPGPKYFYIKQTTETSMNRVKHEIITASIYDQLNTHVDANPNINYDILDNKISQIIKTCMPLKRVKFDKHKHKKSNWITTGLIRSIKFRDKLYLKMKQTPTHSEAYANIKINIKTYNKILKRNIEQAKIMYYHQKLAKYTNDLKNTWKVIKEVTNKTTNKTQLPKFFKLDGKIITDKIDIANQCNTFFTNIGPSLASKITTDGNKTYRSFLNEPSAHEFTFNKITEVDVLNIIDKLPSKASSGMDGISPILLKHIKNEICRPITLILNQCLTNGMFPDK